MEAPQLPHQRRPYSGLVLIVVFRFASLRGLLPSLEISIQLTNSIPTISPVFKSPNHGLNSCRTLAEPVIGSCAFSMKRVELRRELDKRRIAAHHRVT